MRQKLERRSDNKRLVEVVMARLTENGMIDDARYAKQFARQRTESRKQGKFRVARDLRARGIADRHIERSEEHTSELQSQSNLVCRLLLEKKNRMMTRYAAVFDLPATYHRSVP